MRTFIGYKPKPWQAVVHKAIEEAGPKAGKVFVVKSPRQIGKSMLIEQELLRHAINYKNSVNICLSITFNNCKKIFQELKSGIEESGIIQKCDNQAMEIILVNGSTIIFKSAQQRESLRGYTIKNNGILCIDEGAYIMDDIYSIVFPWTNVNHSNILIVSTPRVKTGTFYDYYSTGIQDPGAVVSFDLSKFDTSEMLSAEKIELYRQKMPRAQFTTEILGEFSDSGAGVFDISKNIWIDQAPTYEYLLMGIDWGTGSGGDFTVLSVLNTKAEQVALYRTNDKKPTEQLTWLSSIIHKFDKSRILNILCEENSIGSVYIDLLTASLDGYPIESFVTSNTSKREIIEYMINRVETEDIKLLKDKEQYLEMGSYAMEITSSGAVVYNGLPGVHDDIVMANAFALKGIKDLQANSYDLSFAR